jgi:hypothetical protein
MFFLNLLLSGRLGAFGHTKGSSNCSKTNATCGFAGRAVHRNI